MLMFLIMHNFKISKTLIIFLPTDVHHITIVMHSNLLCGRLMCRLILPISFHDDVIKWKHFPRYWPFVQGIHRLPVNSPHKSQWRGALMFSLICAWINGRVNNPDAGDFETPPQPLWRHCSAWLLNLPWRWGSNLKIIQNQSHDLTRNCKYTWHETNENILFVICTLLCNSRGIVNASKTKGMPRPGFAKVNPDISIKKLQGKRCVPVTIAVTPTFRVIIPVKNLKMINTTWNVFAIAGQLALYNTSFEQIRRWFTPKSRQAITRTDVNQIHCQQVSKMLLIFSNNSTSQELCSWFALCCVFLDIWY